MPESIRGIFANAEANVDSFAARIKTVTGDVKKYEKEILSAQKAGRQLSAETVTNLKMSRSRLESLREEASAAKEAGHAAQHAGHQLHGAARIGSRLQRVLGDEMFRKMARGEKIEFKDVARTALYSDAVVRAVGRTFKLAPGTIAKLHPFLLVASESVFKVQEKLKEDREHKEYADQLREEHRIGRRSDADMEIYNKAEAGGGYTPPGMSGVASLGNLTDFFSSSTRGKDALAKNDKVAAVLAEMSEKEITEAIKEHEDELNKPNLMDPGLDALNRLFPSKVQITDADGKPVSPHEVKRREQVEKQNAQKVYGLDLPPEIALAAHRAAVAGLQVDNDTLETFEKKAQENALQKTKKIPTENEAYHEFHKEKLYRLSLDIYQKRVPACPTD
jgi:hypothetical protein